MKKVIIGFILLFMLSALPVYASEAEEASPMPSKHYAAGLREDEIINIGVAVYPDNSFEISASTTGMSIGPLRYFYVFAENDDPTRDRAILSLGSAGESSQVTTARWKGGYSAFPNERTYEYVDENGMLKPGKYFAVIIDEWGYVLTDKAYFTMPEIDQWWTHAPVPTASPTDPRPTLRDISELNLVRPSPAESKPSVSYVPAPTSTPVKSSGKSSVTGSVPLIVCIILGAFICAEAVYISILRKKKKEK